MVANFDAGRVTSDGGLLLVRDLEARRGIVERLSECFVDYREPGRIEHPVGQLVGQRVFGITFGYEDLNDHDWLCHDPLWAAAVGRRDVLGHDRRRARDYGRPLAGKSTLNRLELGPASAKDIDDYKKIVYDAEAIDRLMVQIFLEAHREPPKQIILDLDATDDKIHGRQEGRFYHGYYRHYCYLPLYIYCGDFLLCSRLRSSNIDAPKGALKELERIVPQIRARWPDVEIVLRGDSGFARDWLMTWCENNNVDFIIGLARNPRLVRAVKPELAAVREAFETTGVPQRTFKELRYQTRTSWSCTRRVVAKAEFIPGKANPRFVVTSLEPGAVDARELYEDLYCARGDMENRLKEAQLDLFADRTSSHTMRANQLRLYFSSFAYILMNELRRIGLAATRMAKAQAGTIRLRLLKVGGLVTQSVRRVRVRLSSAFPNQEVFRIVLGNLRAADVR